MIKDVIINGDALEVLKTIPDQSFHCVVTSPPFWGLRDYGVVGQMGLEGSPEEYIEKMVVLFREVCRVLRDDGTLWLNIGDSYAGGGGYCIGSPSNISSKTGKYFSNSGVATKGRKPAGNIKAKDLVGIPWMLAFALRADGWYLRQDIIWSKPNPMPESVTDRCTRSHEYIFMLSKKGKYWYDAKAIRTPAVEHSLNPSHFSDGSKTEHLIKQRGLKKDKQRGHSRRHAGFNEKLDSMIVAEQRALGANRRSVWQISTAGYPEAHFATFPEEIPALCIKAGCPPGGLVLDTFFGSGTTGVVAKKLGRHYLGIELNPGYVEIANNRLKKELGLFA